MTISNDGKTAVFGSPDLGVVWHLVKWPTQCLLEDHLVNNGGSITAYRVMSPPPGQKCVSDIQTCTNGTLSGSYLFSTCVVTSPGQTPVTAAMLVAFNVLIGWLVRRYPGRAA